MIAKADIRRVQEWMGHADVATTMKYLHYVERPDEAALVAEAFALEPHRRAATSVQRHDADRDDPRVEVAAHEQRPATDLDVRESPASRELVDRRARDSEQ